MTTPRPTFGRWFRPLFFGTYLGAWGAAAVHALTDPRLKWLPYVGVLKWVIYLLAFTLLGFVWLLATSAYDVLLLKLRVRMLPSGLRAWGLAIAAPLLGGAVLKLWPAASTEGLLGWVASTTLPTLLVAAVSRAALGRAP
jgi:hypothetical protein